MIYFCVDTQNFKIKKKAIKSFPKCLKIINLLIYTRYCDLTSTLGATKNIIFF